MARIAPGHISVKMKDIVAVLTLPRLGFNDFWGCAFQSLVEVGIERVTRSSGALWAQTITKSVNDALKFNPSFLLFLDFDTAFTGGDLKQLRKLVDDYQPDALAALQMHRTQSRPLFTLPNDDNGNSVVYITEQQVNHPVLRVKTAHLGCTLVNVKKLMKVEKPWFWSQPNSDGDWTDGKVDADIHFWNQWAKAGNDVYVATHIPVGHMELHIRWPDNDLNVVTQNIQNYIDYGKPDNVWR